MIEIEKFIKNTGTFYYIKGTRTSHREDGPAVILSSGSLYWYKNGFIHRVDGPAIISRDGSIFWYLEDQFFKTKEDWFEELTEEEKSKALYSEYFIGG